MDPEVEDHYKELLSQWKKDEDNIKEELGVIKKMLSVLTTSQEVADQGRQISASKSTRASVTFWKC